MDRPDMEVKPAMISAPPIVASLGLVNHNHRFPLFRVPVLSRKLSRLRKKYPTHNAFWKDFYLRNTTIMSTL